MTAEAVRMRGREAFMTLIFKLVGNDCQMMCDVLPLTAGASPSRAPGGEPLQESRADTAPIAVPI
ncbi:hypothetical protein GCM10012287_39220 [Streptomyces daqingensis]|uniref:Uncharacterized protein n=1 Tax=Streptomyces daqingensis TaxID=1472640 RepID=A0ABQ2MJY0_9ACTN|nr:hypothetical protein GCM10012287_39220 [Streptomyces daqingensis]